MSDIPHAKSLYMYESRRSGIKESNEPIEGIFFIIGGLLVPDYYSECLFSEVDVNPFSEINKRNPYKRAMYHDYFFRRYIAYAYKDIASGVDLIPRGRVRKMINASPNILIDMCHFNNEGLMADIIKLYRISGDILVANNSEYRCLACRIEGCYDAASYVIAV